jgi:hypothetical protein
MGAIIGIAAFGRTQEKLAGANSVEMQPMGQSVTATYGSPSTGRFEPSSSFGSPTPNGFGATSKSVSGKSARFAEADPDSVFDRG